MRRFKVRWLLLVLPILLLSTGWLVSAPTPKDLPTRTQGQSASEVLRKTLDLTVDLEYTNLDLPNTIRAIGAEYKLNVVINRGSFNDLDPDDINNVDLNVKQISLRSGLRSLLGRFGLTFAVVGDTLAVGTEEQVLRSQTHQPIDVHLSDKPLGKVLPDIAKYYGVNIVIDPRLNAKKDGPLSTLVTMEVSDAPLDASLKILCDAADLTVVQANNIFYITTEKQADKLKKTLEPSVKNNDSVERTPSRLPPIGPVPGPIMPGGLERIAPSN